MKNVLIRTKKTLTVAECFDFFLRKCAVRNLSPNTIETYQVHFRVFQRFLIDDEFMIADININTVENFIFHLKESNTRNDISVNSYLRDLRVFLYFCMDEGYMSAFKIHLIKVSKEIKETYTDAELKILLKKPSLKTCDFTEYKIWVFSNYLLATGNRISSALN